MSFLALKLISRTIPCFIPQYECRRGISFLRNLFRRAIRKPIGINVEDYKCFYHLPVIPIFSSSAKKKYFRCTAIVISLSAMIYFYNKGDISDELFIEFACAGVMLLIISLLSAYVGTNLIGKMYLHKNKKEIMISYANCYGERCFKSCTLDDIKVVDHPNIFFRRYLKIVVNNKSGQNFKLMTSGAKVNVLIFEPLFPNVEV